MSTEDRVSNFDPKTLFFTHGCSGGWSPAVEGVSSFYRLGDHFDPAEFYGAVAGVAQLIDWPSEMGGREAIGDPEFGALSIFSFQPSGR